MSSLDEQISFAETLVRSAQITISGFEFRLEQLNADRVEIDKLEAQLRKDVDAAPALLLRGQERYRSLVQMKRSVGVTGGRSADPVKRRAKLVDRHAKLVAKLEQLQKEIENV